jgi:hypothetical protein
MVASIDPMRRSSAVSSWALPVDRDPLAPLEPCLRIHPAGMLCIPHVDLGHLDGQLPRRWDQGARAIDSEHRSEGVIEPGQNDLHPKV